MVRTGEGFRAQKKVTDDFGRTHNIISSPCEDYESVRSYPDLGAKGNKVL